MSLPIALQLFSVHEEIDVDFESTIKKIADIGYDGVEFGGFYGKEPQEIKEIFTKYNLTPISAHNDIENFANKDITTTIKNYKIVGVKYVVVPWLNPDRWPGAENFDDTIELIKKVGYIARENDIQLLYHNHDFELLTHVGDNLGLDEIYDRVPADLLQCELDVGWIHAAGPDPLEFVRKYADRSPVIHLKNYFVEPETFAEYRKIGKAFRDQHVMDFRPSNDGLVDMEAVVKEVENTNVEWLIVEQDKASKGHTIYEGIEQSLKHLKSIQ